MDLIRYWFDDASRRTVASFVLGRPIGEKQTYRRGTTKDSFCKNKTYNRYETRTSLFYDVV